MDLEETTQREFIAEGRNGKVFQSRDKDGNDIAIKVVTEGGLLSISANYFFLGAPNAYNWNEDAILSAYYRRQVLAELVDYWFGSKLRVAKSLDTKWNEEFKGYEITTEYIDGRHASLHHPFSKQKEEELSDLIKNIMEPLQDRLIESGFDGLLWQAGKGIPAASANFMLEQSNGDENEWAWIDLESGLPAVAPLNPISFFSFYLLKSIKHKHPLFDDVDMDKLRAYIDENKEGLESKIDAGRYSILLGNIDSLEFHQKKWKSLRRAHRSITYRLKKDKISQKHANWYFEHPDKLHDAVWYGREIARLSWKAYSGLIADIPYEIDLRLTLFDYKKAASNVWRFISSGKYRSEVATNYVRSRINLWKERSQLEPEESDYLRSQLETETTSPYLTDLLFHAGLKFVDWGIVFASGTTYFKGITGPIESGLLALLGGPILRSTYTLGKIGYSKIKPNLGKEQSRLIALAVGMIPTFGNAAYPIQMIYSGSTEDRKLGEFLLYDSFSRAGEKIPVYGGRDTRTEHFFNHFPDLLVRNRQGLNSQSQ
ncbi:MAG: hypothetical protein IH934_00190 [Nanoarchaeota archaeon]|nr:hypothetical protein [Nanoarchaeota archaeon]